MFVLGAGASRDVTEPGPYPSFVDTDFYDLLLRESAKRGASRYLREIVLLSKTTPGSQPWRSMEYLFYSLYLHLAMKQEVCRESGRRVDVASFINDFTRCIMRLLRLALGGRHSHLHARLFTALQPGDSVITFNYDLLVESTLVKLRSDLNVDEQLYGFGTLPSQRVSRLTIHKLHGSLNWNCCGPILTPDEFEVAQWPRRLYLTPRSYVPHKDLRPAILLPFWDKPIEGGRWASVWRGAAQDLRRAKDVIIWGYSMPATDIKSTELFRQTLSGEHRHPRNLAVIDPNTAVHDRWRSMCPDAVYWGYHHIFELTNNPPAWLAVREPQIVDVQREPHPPRHSSRGARR